MISRREIELHVVRRAQGRCEYCQMHQSLQGATFHIEHIVPRSLGGTFDAENLALACPSCNLHKSNRVQVETADGTEAIPLFHPRQDRWQEHFRWDQFEIVGLTPVAQATIKALRLNEERRIKVRRAEAMFQLFPPHAS